MKRVILVLGIAVMTVCTAGSAFARGKKESIQRDLGTFTAIMLMTPSVRVEVLETQKDARLEASLDGRRELSVTEAGGTLRIEVSTLRAMTTPNEILRLFIPQGRAIEIQSGSGRVQVKDLEYRELTVESGSGSVTVEDSIGPMNIATGSGRILVTDSDGDKVFKSGSGTINVNGSDGAIEASNGSGRIELNNVDGTLDISTGSGGISGEAVMLTGDSRFETGSGRINLNLLNAESELSFDLETNSGTLKVGGNRASGKLIFGKGAVKLTGRTGSGSQTYSYK